MHRTDQVADGKVERARLEIGVCGICGRMSGEVASAILASADLRLCGCTEAPDHELIGHEASEILGGLAPGLRITADVEAVARAADVVMDFTCPAATLETARACARCGTAIVVGTTGFTDAEREEFERRVRPVACVYAPNYSTAMNLLFKLVRDAAAVLGDLYDVEIIEAHHRHKVDAPSGTALHLARQAAAGLGRNLDEVGVYGRHGIVGERPVQQIGIHAVRVGDLAGDHAVLYGGVGEILELRHRATSRQALAQGALRAARFAAAAKPGLYSMQDVLGLTED